MRVLILLIVASASTLSAESTFYESARVRRSPDPQWSFGSFGTPLGMGGRFGYSHDLFSSPRGSFSAGFEGVKSNPRSDFGFSTGATGRLNLGGLNDNSPMGSLGALGASWRQSVNGPDNRPAFNLNYQTKPIENNLGSFGVLATADRQPGQNWQSSLTAKQTLGGNDFVSASVAKSLGGPETRPAFSVAGQRNIFDNGRTSVDASLAANKQPGQDWITSGKLSASHQLGEGPGNAGTLTGSLQKNFNGPNTDPTIGLGYSKNLAKGKDGSIDFVAGVSKTAKDVAGSTGIEVKF